MSFVYVSVPTGLTRVKAAVRFAAEDPWNDNRRNWFTVDDYMVTLRGTKSVLEGAQEARWLGGFHRALRSEADGKTRFLPESLIELWLTRQVASEALPRMLKEIEPTLRKGDYKPILHSRLMHIFGVVETVLCVLMVIIAMVGVVLGQAPVLIAVAVILGAAGICWSFLYVAYYGKIFRRKRQMRWLLERVHVGVSSAVVLPDTITDMGASHVGVPPKTRPVSPQPARKFVSSIVLADAEERTLLRKLRAAFPELAWQDGEGNFGKIHLAGESAEKPAKIHLAGESAEKPAKIGVHLLCKEPPGPFTLTIRLEPTEGASAQAEALKARVLKALVEVIPQSAHPLNPFSGNVERWASPPSSPPPFDPEFNIGGKSGPPPPPLISPQPMPLQTRVHSTKLDGKPTQTSRTLADPLALSPQSAPLQPPKDFVFDSIMEVPEVMEPAIEPRLRRAFPELEWEDYADAVNWDTIRISGTCREAPQRIVISIRRNESPGPFRLGVTVSARDQPEAEKCHRVMLDRLQSALLGWSLFHLPKFKTRPPSGINIDREEIVDLQFPLERPLVNVFKVDVDILISQILLDALATNGSILDSRAETLPGGAANSDDPENRNARMRGAAARQILQQAVSSGSGDDLQVALVLVGNAHHLIGELLEHGLAQVVQYGADGRKPGGKSISPKRIKVHHFGSRASPKVGMGHISFSAVDGDSRDLGEFLHIDW